MFKVIDWVKNIYFSFHFLIFSIFISIFFIFNIRTNYYIEFLSSKIGLNFLIDKLLSYLTVVVFLIFIFIVIFSFKSVEYRKFFKSFDKQFKYISIIVSTLFFLGAMFLKYEFIKVNEESKVITAFVNNIVVNKADVNLVNIYFSLFLICILLILLIIFFSLLLNFDIEDYKEKNKLYLDYILTEKGWFKGNYKLSYYSEETKIIEPNKILLVVRAFINSENIEKFEERYYIYNYQKIENLNNQELKKEEFYIEKVMLIKKYYNNNEISKYYKKYSNYALEQSNIENINILKEFKGMENK